MHKKEFRSQNLEGEINKGISILGSNFCIPSSQFQLLRF